MLEREREREYELLLACLRPGRRDGEDLHRNEADNTAPAKADAAAVEQAHVQTVRPSAHLFQNMAILFGKARRNALLLLLDLAGWAAVAAVDGDVFEKGVLRQVLAAGSGKRGAAAWTLWATLGAERGKTGNRCSAYL